MFIFGGSNMHGTGPAGPSYQVPRSVRLRSSASAYLYQRLATPTNNLQWTWSGWIKRGTLSGSTVLMEAGPGSGNRANINITSDQISFYAANGTNIAYVTTAVFQDIAAWYHVVVVFDSANAVPTSRIKIYVNNILQPLTISTQISQNTSTYINDAYVHAIGSTSYTPGSYFDGYMADVYFIDGQALDPSYFGQIDSLWGTWTAITFAGTSYGNNGFYLPFNNVTSTTLLGHDYSISRPYDTLYSSDVVLLQFNGTNGSTTITDSGPLSLPCAAIGGAIISTAQSKYGGSSAAFNGSTAGVTVTVGPAYQPTTQPFTVETWVYLNSSGTPQTIMQWNVNLGIAGILIFYDGSAINVVCSDSNPSGWEVAIGVSAPMNQWFHLAVQRSVSNDFSIYINGVLGATQNWSGSIFYNGSTAISIGICDSINWWPLNGYLDDFRITFGIARYTSNFTPTQILLGFDQVGNNFTANNVSLTAGSTYDSMYDVPLGAGSAGGNGLGNYATLNPLNRATSNGTPISILDGNLRLTSSANVLSTGVVSCTQGIYSGKWYYEGRVLATATTSSDNFAIGVSTAFVNSDFGPVSYLYSNIISPNSTIMVNLSTVQGGFTPASLGDILGCAVDLDNHIVTFYKNGVLQGTPVTGIPVNTYYPVAYIGNSAASTTGWQVSMNFGQQPFTYAPPAGYIALHTGNLPTPVIKQPNKYFDAVSYTGTNALALNQFPDGTPDANFSSVSLLLHSNGTDGSTSVLDSSSNANSITAVGTARISATQSKFGGSSIYFDGAGGYLTSPSSMAYALGTVWTIETWLYPIGYGGILLDVRNSNTSGYVYLDGSGHITVPLGPYSPPSSTLVSSSTIPLNTWTHVAICADGNGTRIFLNGVLDNQQTNPSYASNWATTAQVLFIGCTFSVDTFYNGYMDDFRITKGIARYTTTFNVSWAVDRVAFQPDLVWIKARSASTAHKLVDSVRGVTLAISSNVSDAQVTDAQGLLSFDANGFTVGPDTNYNAPGSVYVAWQWKKGATPGFDIVNYVGNGFAQNINHSLGTAANMIIVKDLSGVNNWPVWHTSLTSVNWYTLLNTTAAQISDSTMFAGLMSSTQFSIGSNTAINGTGHSYIAYLFTAIQGYSLFGSYTGNGSTDGPFVYCGFRPKYILIKDITSTSSWFVYDSSRDTFNSIQHWLAADNIINENITTYGNFTATGFKIMSTNTAFNSSGDAYIYMAFAESPFKYSLAR